MKLSDHFDQIHCINLDHRTDRWSQFCNDFSRIENPDVVQRFPAIQCSPSNDPVINGRVGCLLSHRGVLESAYRSGAVTVLVFEDDAVFSAGANTSLLRSLTQLNNIQWDIFFLGTNPIGPMREAPPALAVLSRSLALHAVAFHHTTIVKLLNTLPDNPEEAYNWIRRYKSIDRYIATHIMPRSRSYCAWPMACYQRDNYSDIGKTNTYNFENMIAQKIEKHLSTAHLSWTLRKKSWDLIGYPISLLHELLRYRRSIKKDEKDY